MQDLAPVGIVSSIVQAVIVKKDLPVKSMAELVSYAKANPGKLNYGSSGAGGLTHFSVELFQARTGTKMVHIPFKGGAPSTAAVVSGEVDLSFANMTDAPAAGPGRNGPRPGRDVARTQPLLSRSALGARGGPSRTSLWRRGTASWPRRKTPEPIIRKLSEVLIKMADDPEVKETMRKAGANTVKTTPEQYRAQIGQEIAQWKPLIEEIARRSDRRGVRQG